MSSRKGANASSSRTQGSTSARSKHALKSSGASFESEDAHMSDFLADNDDAGAQHLDDHEGDAGSAVDDEMEEGDGGDDEVVGEGDDDQEEGERDDDEGEEGEDDDEEGPFDDDMDDPYGDDIFGGSGFAANLRAMAGFLSGAQTRYRGLLSSLRNRKDPSTQLVALQELSEALSLANEDTLAGYFPTESFVRELVYIMGGPKPPVTGSNAVEQDSDEDMTAIEVAQAAGLVDKGEMTLLACRCLANLIEAMPYAAHTVVSFGAVPVLLSKLTEIEFIDLAEQTLQVSLTLDDGIQTLQEALLTSAFLLDPQTLEKIAQEYPVSIVREGGLMAMLQYLDFFNIHIQRTAMTAASHCCRKLSTEHFAKVRDVVPIIRNVLGYADQRLVESACKCIVRLIDSFRHASELLEQLLDSELVQALNALLLQGSPTSGSSASTSISTGTYTEVLKSLGIAVRASPKIAVTLLETNIVETLYTLLTGSAAPAEDGSGGEGPASTKSPLVAAPAMQLESTGRDNAADMAAVAVLGHAENGDSVAVADMAILHNLAHRPKEQIQEALSLVSEILPPLPRDGVFDPRAYSEKAWHKARRADRARREKLRSRNGRPSSSSKRSEAVSQATTETSNPITLDDEQAQAAATAAAPTKPERVKSEKELLKEQAQNRRIEMLRERRSVVKRFTQLVLPTLVEVYAASVALHVRSKALVGMLKIISFVEAEPLHQVLDTVPLASFVASILSSRDDPSLVLSALQIVELLCQKLPHVYKSLLRREGVMWEIEDVASEQPSASKLTGTPKTLQKLTLPGEKPSEPAAAEGAPASSETQPAGSAPAASGATATAADKATTSLANEAKDAVIWRARILRDAFAREADNADGGADHAIKALDTVKYLVEALQRSTHSQRAAAAAEAALDQITALFSRAEEPISSFELLRSGLIDGLYSFASGDSPTLSLSARRELLIKALMTPDSSGQSRGSALVRRLQESLSRLENVEIVTTLSGGADELRYRAISPVSRQIRLRLQAEDGTDVPKGCNNIIVGIHAIASFERLADFLRPKMNNMAALAAIGSGSGNSRLSTVLAALTGGSAGLESALAAGRTSQQARTANGSAASASADAPSSSKAESSSSSSANKAVRRRSSRLSGKSAGSSRDAEREEEEEEGEEESAMSEKLEEAGSGSESNTKGKSVANGDESGRAASASDGQSEKETEEEAARKLMEGLFGEGLEDDGYSDEELGDEIFEDELGPDSSLANTSANDRTVNLSVDEDGGKVEVKTPDGTRIPTPSSTSATSAAPPPSSSPSRPSYAAALQRKPSDWHIDFSMDGQELPLDSTIYAAVHQHETNPKRSSSSTTSTSSSRNIWNNVYTVKFKKVAGPVPSKESQQTPEPESAQSAAAELPASMSPESSFAKILQLLRVLHDLNSEWRETRLSSLAATGKTAALSETVFVNNKLTAKLNRQLEEPMIVASKCLPEWSLYLPRKFSFLFPFEARYAFLQSTAFGYSRMLSRWLSNTTRNQDSSSGSASRVEDQTLAHLGRLPRAKVRIARDNILASAFRVMDLYGKTDTILEVEYFDEVGTGLGPTLEFYSLTSKEFARKDLRLWRDNGSADSTSPYVYSPSGLFPAPISEQAKATSKGKEILNSFRILGHFIAKAILDSRIIDCNFSPVFLRAILNQRVAPTLSTLKVVDARLAASLEKILQMREEDLSAMGLDFTLPGDADFELRPGGKDIEVTSANVQDYVDEVVDVILRRGIEPCVRSFRSGFNRIFPVSAMTSFTAEELVMLFGNAEEDWSEATLTATLKPDHGYSSESTTFRDLISIMSSFDLNERREFLQWLTGSPKLPIGGFGGLQPQLTVVKRPHEAPLKPDDYLASNMSCANFLKLPQYSSKEVMRRRLQTAVREGAGAFNLS